MTTGQTSRIGRSFGAQVINDFLVGFKYHADALWQIESTGQYGDVRGHGCVISSSRRKKATASWRWRAVRDKEFRGSGFYCWRKPQLYQKRQGRTLVDYLDDLNRQFGYYRNELLNIVLTGLEGKVNMGRMLDALAEEPAEPRSAGLPVSFVEDLQDPEGRMGAVQGRHRQGRGNFLIFQPRGRRRSSEGLLCGRAEQSRKRRRISEVCGEPVETGHAASRMGCRAAIDSRVQLVCDRLPGAQLLATIGQKPTPGADKLSRWISK